MSSKLTLEEVKAEFERWRTERKNSRQTIPQYLWPLVKQLTGRYKSTEIARELRLNHQQFKAHVGNTKIKQTKTAKASSTPHELITFAPVNMPMTIQQPALTVELKQPDGQTIVLHANSDAAIASIVERLITPCMGGK